MAEITSGEQSITGRLRVSFAQIITIFSLFLSAAGLYAHDEARLGQLEVSVSRIEQSNLSPRVSALETGFDDLKNEMHMINKNLIVIHEDLRDKADKRSR